ncbi:MAG: HAD family phosphatase, partial [Prevotella sp.]|nr:HAD family phosphatase [Candidatus Prevotella equi]
MLIALDLDGTLTNEQKEITPYTYEVLMRMQQQGARLCLASGRPPFGMRPLAEQLHMADYGGILLCYNGGHVEECGSGKVLVEQPLNEAYLPELHDFQQQSGMTLMTYYEDCIYTEKPDDEYVAVSARNNKMKVVKVEDFVRDIPRPVNKCLMVGSPEKVAQWEPVMAKAMEGRMHVCHSTPYFVELLPLGIDKGPSLMKLLSQLGMTPEDLIAFGDSYNDLTMLQLAGKGVAMGNAE